MEWKKILYLSMKWVCVREEVFVSEWKKGWSEEKMWVYVPNDEFWK